MIRPYVFNSPDYLELEAERVGGTPFRLARENGAVIGLILRQIPGSALRDGISVYGYPDLDQREPAAGCVGADSILEALRNARALDGLVSAYFRLGLDQDVQGPLDRSLARKVRVGDVVVLDLQREPTQIFSSFQPSLRARIKKNRDGIKVESSEDVAAFHAIYTQNMARVGAENYYFFDQNYLRRLIGLPGVDLILGMDDTGPLAGALIVSHGDLLFYHLGASTDRGLARSALKCVLSEFIRRCAGGPFRRLVLGGGRGGQDDSLLEFKRGFSSEMQSAYALKAVLDSRSYAALSGARHEHDPFAGFFPAYRDPVRTDKVSPCPPPNSQTGPRFQKTK